MSKRDPVKHPVLKSSGFAAICALLCLAGAGSRPASQAAGPRSALVFTATPRFDSVAWVRAGERFPQGSKIIVSSGAGQRSLAAGFFAAADPEVSFDARRVLFAGKQRREDHWQIWEAPLDGGSPARITRFEEDCIRPLYAPAGKVIYARKLRGEFQLELMAAGGGEPPRLTYAPGNFLPSQILRDGRVLFEGPHPFGGAGGTELYTVYTDGSGVEAFRCDHDKARHAARQVASGDIVFTTNNGLGRFTPAHTSEIGIPAPEGEVAGPIAETAPGRWMISLKPKGRSRFGLYEWTPGSAGRPVLRVAASMNAVQPVVVKPREVPPRHPSGLHNRPGGNLLCLNSYESPLSLAGGAISSMRLYARDAGGKAVMLGQASVESDGSFFVQAPTEQALRIELLDRSGRVLAAEKGWFWMRRGEQRICVGCHAGPERAPENVAPMVLARPGVPVQMTDDTGVR